MVEDKLPRFHYGYVIVGLGFLIVAISMAARGTFGIFFEPILDEFGWTRAATAGAQSVSAIVGGLFGILAGRWVDRFGPRFVLTLACFFTGLGLVLLSQISAMWQLYLCFAIIAAGGTGYLHPMVTTVSRWFVKKRGVMTSIIISALGTSEMVMPPLASWLIGSFGWRNSYIILGVSLFLFIMITAQFIRRDPGQLGMTAYGEGEVEPGGVSIQMTGLSLQEAMRGREFWVFSAILVCYLFGATAVSTHIVIHATGLGFSPVSAANILSIIGAMYIVSLNITGGVADKMGKRSAIALGFILQVVSLFCLVAAKDLWLLYLVGAVYGFGRGTAMAPMPLLMADVFGLKSFGVIQGAIFVGAALGTVLGPVIMGYIFDITGSYVIALITCSAINIIGLMLTFFIRHR